MTQELEGIRIACLATDGVEQVELVKPWEAYEKAGATVELVAPHPGRIRAFRHLDPGDAFDVDRQVSEVSADDYDCLFLPGGVINGDALRMDEDAVRFVAGFADAEKPIAVICHGSWILIEARVVAGRPLTSWPSLRTDLENAGAVWVDEEVHVDHNLVSSRKPADLPAFIAKSIEIFAALPERGEARERWRRAQARDEVEQSSRESFPASDSPSWT